MVIFPCVQFASIWQTPIIRPGKLCDCIDAALAFHTSVCVLRAVTVPPAAAAASAASAAAPRNGFWWGLSEKVTYLCWLLLKRPTYLLKFKSEMVNWPYLYRCPYVNWRCQPCPVWGVGRWQSAFACCRHFSPHLSFESCFFSYLKVWFAWW